MIFLVKKIQFLLPVLLLFSVNIAAEKGANLVFETTEHHFGEIYLGSGSVQHCFTFQNKGEKPVWIKTVRSSCGCVYGIWTNKPVAPADTGSVCIVYKNNISGAFRKKLKVISNAGKATLIIEGNTIRK
jgi:hypothetical protein